MNGRPFLFGGSMQHFDHHDTIAAISTAPGPGGIAVLRISGDKARDIALKLLDVPDMEPRYAQFCHAVDPENRETLDEVIALFFKAPASYTGEDTVEISCHGGNAAAPSILKVCYDLGARPAQPGEFTRRAFMNGKMDLLQAEAVADLIHAVSNSGRKLANRVLAGKLSERIRDLHHELMDIASVLELELDFSEQEITVMDRAELREKIRAAERHIADLAAGYSAGRLLREGALVAIAGRPNTGKSSLLNALLREERAIISPIPGTTRDTIEESIIHKGMLFRLVDTAGLRETEDPLERIGNTRARNAIRNADLLLLLADLSKADDLHFEKQFIAKHKEKPLILVLNKCDLGDWAPEIPDVRHLRISATGALNLDVLLDAMFEMLQKHYRLDGESVSISRERQRRALLQSLEALKRAGEAVENHDSNEFIALDIREAIDALETITGETRSEDILNHIFDRFCIGK